MDVKNEIRLVKQKIYNEIEALRFYKELSYICDKLIQEVEEYKYDENDDLSLKKYLAFLEVFLELKIGSINRMIVENQNQSVFDNRTPEKEQELKDLEAEIEEILAYVSENIPSIGREAARKYEELKKFYTEMIEYTKVSSKRRFDTDLGYNEEAPILSIYSDTSAATKSYIFQLQEFKNDYMENIREFVDNDKLVKLALKKARESNDPKALESVQKIEEQYNGIIETLSRSDNMFVKITLLQMQKNLKAVIEQLDIIIKAENNRRNVLNKILSMKTSYDNVEELLEIERYVLDNDDLKEEFYKVLFALIERDKYLFEQFEVESKIYDKLSNESKLILERMFIERLSSLDSDTAQEYITRLKKDGYFRVVDKLYKDIYSQMKYEEKPAYTIEKEPSEEKINITFNIGTFGRNYYEITDRATGKVIDRVKVRQISNNRDGSITKNNGLYTIEVYASSIKVGEHREHHYLNFDENGRRINTPSKDTEVIERVFDKYYIIRRPNNGFYYYQIMDQYGDVLYAKTLNDGEKEIIFNEYRIDYDKKAIIALDNPSKKMLIIDEDIYLRNTYDYQTLANLSSIDYDPESHKYERSAYPSLALADCVNDMIVPVTFRAGAETSLIHVFFGLDADYIDRFPTESYASERVGYSDELYCFKNESTGLWGYKSRYGREVIPPRFAKAWPFYDGIARVCTIGGDGQTRIEMIDKKGNTIDVRRFVKDWHETVTSPKKKRYEFIDRDGNVYVYKPKYQYTLGNGELLINLERKPHLSPLDSYRKH